MRCFGNRLSVFYLYHNCDMDTFGSRVRETRKALKWTQKQLASAAGLSQTTISDIERGRNDSSADIIALARSLRVSAEWLADGRGPKTLSDRDENHADAGGVLLSLNSAKEPDPPKYTPHEERTFFGGEAIARFARLTPEGQDLVRTMLVAGIAEAERRQLVQANAI